MGAPSRTSRTCATGIDAAPSAVLGFVSDARNLPAWAPAFAAQVRPGAAGTWFVASREGEREVVVRTSAELGVVDFLAAHSRQLGASLRVLPSGSGSHVTFTLLFDSSTEAAVIAAEMRSADEELARLRRLLGS